MGVLKLDPKTVSAEAILALPDDGVGREIVRGELRERPWIFRTPEHAHVLATFCYLLVTWRESQPRPHGSILSGNPGFRLHRVPETFIGIDLAYVSAEMNAARPRKQPFHDGAPALAVEILSPWDEHWDIVEKVQLYRDAGSLVWVVDPDFRTVAVHRPRQPVVVLNDRQELTGDPELPGFRVAVALIFDD